MYFVMLTVLGLAATLALTPGRHAAWTWLTKPLASAGFVGLAIQLGGLDSTYGRVVLAGRVLALAGDVLLIPKDRRAFPAGLASFLLAHVAYLAAFAIRGVDWVAFGGAFVAVALVLAVVLRWLWPHLAGPMRVAVPAYVVAIGLMVTGSIATAALSPAAWEIPAGAMLFMASDLFVARHRFVAPGFVNRLVGLPLYYAGQLLIAWSVTGATAGQC